MSTPLSDTINMIHAVSINSANTASNPSNTVTNQQQSNSSSPPHTTTEEEPDSPNTIIKKKKKQSRKKRYKIQKEKQLRIKTEIAHLKEKYSSPFESVWDQLPSISFDKDGNFKIGNKSHHKSILNAYTVVKHIANNKYKITYIHCTQFNANIGYPSKPNLSYGSASQTKPQYSHNFETEIKCLQQEFCIDTIRMLWHYRTLQIKIQQKKKAPHSKIKLFKHDSQSNSKYSKSIPLTFRREANAMIERLEIKDPVESVASETEAEDDIQCGW
eukprot:56452_1